jgi:hypothetical protein
MRFPRLASVAILAILNPAVSASEAALQIDARELKEIASEGYVFFYPLVSMDITRRMTTNLPAGAKPGYGPANRFSHMRTFPDAGFRDVVRPNFDTLYSSGWLDLRQGPLVVSAPDTHGRHYLLPMLDMWSDVIAVPGKRTSGTAPFRAVVTPPGWKGNIPSDMAHIEATTSFVWVIGRTQTNGPADYPAVHAIQDGYLITPLSELGKPATPPPAHEPDKTIDMKTPPLDQVNSMPGPRYFAYAAELMKLNPPHATDWSQIERLRRLGIEPGKSYDVDAQRPEVRAALELGASEGLKSMVAKLPTLARVVDGWQMNTDSMGVYGNYYLKRAIVAMVGLGANQPEDAIYPLCISDTDGNPLVGNQRYVLHFPKDRLPPVGAFWSVTMYDEAGFQVSNSLNRFAIGDRDQLTFNPDGSLDIFIQHEDPGADKRSNWLPAPATGKLGVTMRLYAPKPQALDGRWTPPGVRVVR